mmetsp:Transcript_53723/g.61578  ORF Transcript_53723/g.61578 Transcript_53723/m.61578 type:complete len:396 (+) Transcript_53723:241-1428(+)
MDRELFPLTNENSMEVSYYGYVDEGLPSLRGLYVIMNHVFVGEFNSVEYKKVGVFWSYLGEIYKGNFRFTPYYGIMDNMLDYILRINNESSQEGEEALNLEDEDGQQDETTNVTGSLDNLEINVSGVSKNRDRSPTPEKTELSNINEEEGISINHEKEPGLGGSDSDDTLDLRIEKISPRESSLSKHLSSARKSSRKQQRQDDTLNFSKSGAQSSSDEDTPGTNQSHLSKIGNSHLSGISKGNASRVSKASSKDNNPLKKIMSGGDLSQISEIPGRSGTRGVESRGSSRGLSRDSKLSGLNLRYEKGSRVSNEVIEEREREDTLNETSTIQGNTNTRTNILKNVDIKHMEFVQRPIYFAVVTKYVGTAYSGDVFCKYSDENGRLLLLLERFFPDY